MPFQKRYPAYSGEILSVSELFTMEIVDMVLFLVWFWASGVPFYTLWHCVSIVLCSLKVISFLQGKVGFLSLVLKHIDTSAMMDVLLRLISCVEPPPLRLETLTVRDKLTHIYEILPTDVLCNNNVSLFSTVAEWREVGPETHRAHSSWERWRGTMSVQYFHAKE